MKPIKMIFTSEWTNDLKQKIRELELIPRLMIFHCNNDDKATNIYLKNKQKYAEKLGISISIQNPVNSGNLFDLIHNNTLSTYPYQMMLQQPAPKELIELFQRELTDYEELDVEGLSNRNIMQRHQEAIKGAVDLKKMILPCTVAGNLKLIEEYLPGFSYDGKVALVIGRSEITGTPMAEVLEGLNCTVIRANSHTKKLNELCLIADIIVSCVGKPNLITTCKPGAVLIDNGVSLINGHQCGDISKGCWYKSLAYTPWTGATGKATVHCLFENLYKNEKIIESI